MFFKVFCWPKFTSFYTCVYRFDSSSFSKHFSALLVTIDKTRTCVKALSFFHCQACALALCTCVPFLPTYVK